MAAASEDGDSSNFCFPVTIFCGDHYADVSIPYEATAHEVSAIIKETFGVRGSFLLQIKNYDDRKALTVLEPLKSLYLHCSSTKATVLERYKDFVWEIRGSSCKYGVLLLSFNTLMFMGIEVLASLEHKLADKLY